MKITCLTGILILLFLTLTSADAQIYVRVNQAGYLPEDNKIAIAFTDNQVRGSFKVIDLKSGRTVLEAPLDKAEPKGWGNFSNYFELDFSGVSEPGRYQLVIPSIGGKSGAFSIGDNVYRTYADTMLVFMRQQRCGYNPYLDVDCHRKDGKTMYGPMPDSTFIDVSGGWHDAGDQLKYLITGSNATARMLMAWKAAPEIFPDRVAASGRPCPNGIPDVLDEAKWGLDWIHRLHPAPGQLFFQVADDRDHLGWKWPDRDSSDYGWGRGEHRVAYFATGKPQGLKKYQSEATGIANISGRSAAAMALGYDIWKNDLHDTVFADKCLEAALDLYAMGKKQEGFQQGNSYGAPYRYAEDTWADDMEWAAVELYKVTGDKTYLDDAVNYALKAGNQSWMNYDSSNHYQFYPFANVSHAFLYDHAGKELKEKLAGFYRDNFRKIVQRAGSNPFSSGVTFIWCSNNLLTNLITQILLYEEMTGDRQYHDLMLAQRDWLFGRNPWGTSMFTGIPAGGEYPEDVHTSVWYLTHKMVPGGLVDGPVLGTIYRNLIGLELNSPDEFAAFQTNYVVYHDDIGDYSTNEPTMDGTADAIYMMALLWKSGHR
jgi:endoglucanase